MKLALKVVLATLLATLTVLVVFGWVRVRREVDLFDSDMRKDHRLIGATLAVGIVATRPSTSTDGVLELIRRADAERPALRISWITRDGRQRVGAPVFRHDIGGLRAIDQTTHADPTRDRQFLVTRIPVIDAGELLGAIEIAESLDARNAYIRTSIWTTALATLTMLLLSGVVVLVVGVLLVGRPLRALAGKAKRVGRGDLSGPLELGQRDEIGELAREVNAMCERLAEANARTQAETTARIEALDQLRHADRLITVGRLAAGIAHELGTPLNVIAGRVKMLQRPGLEPRVASGYLSAVADQAQRMTGTIRQLLDFARPREPKVAPTDLRSIARSAANLLGPLATKRGVDLSIASHESVLALGDRVQLEQVVSNLLVNAIHACENGGRVTIRVGTEREGQAGSTEPRAVLSVSDDGHGMDAETLSRVFEPFFTTKDVGQGTGLGLSVAHGIVEEHGGSIRVESAPGRGSTFSVRLRMASS